MFLNYGLYILYFLYRFNPNNAWIHFNYANLMEEEFKDDKTAEVHYKKCLEIDDKYCAAYHNYAVLMHKRNELKKAKLYYKVALKLNNKCNLTQRNYALCLISMQKYNDAYHHLQLAFNLCIKKQKISTFDWNQKVDFMKDSVDLNNSEATEIILLLQHTLEQNEALCQDYEEGKKMLS